MGRMRFVHRSIARGAVDLAAGGVYDSPHRLHPSGFQYVERSDEVGLSDTARVFIRVGNRDQRAKVKYGVDPRGRAAHSFRVAQIAVENFDLAECRGCRMSQIADSAARIVAHEAPHVRAALREGLGQVTPDKTAGAGDEDTPTVPIHLRVLPCVGANLEGDPQAIVPDLCWV